MKEQSFAMFERQAARENGRYSKMFTCEVCGKPVGYSYYSAASCNTTGKGTVLCKKCCKAWDTADNASKE